MELERPFRRSHAMYEVAAQILSTPREKHYGYRLCQCTGISPGSLFPILQRFAKAGWLSAEWEIPAEPRARPPRRYYSLTDSGATALETIIARGRPARPAHRRGGRR